MDEVFQKNKYLFHVTLPRGLPIKIACTFFLSHMLGIMGTPREGTACGGEWEGN